jgi:Tol biopolymer transport system component
VAYRSAASNLVAGDTNNQDDVFVHDRQTGSTARVSVGAGGVQANGPSRAPAFSGDGQFVAFVSGATNLVPGDSNARDDVFVCELATGAVTRASVATGGAQANGASSFPALSFDGRVVAFTSLASNLAPGDTNAWEDVFTRDRATGTTARVSVGPGGVQGNGRSGHTGVSVDFGGTRIAFASSSTNFAVPDTNSVDDVFVRDTANGRTLRATLNSNQDEANGTSGTPAISADGRIVAFWSDSNDLLPFIDDNNVIDVWIRDLLTDTTVIVSSDPNLVVGNGESREPLAISADGRVVACRSVAGNLVEADTNGVADVFARELLPALWTVDHVYPNWQVGLYLNAPGEQHRLYVMGLSTGYRPGIAVDERTIPLVSDPLLLLSLTDTTTFSHFVGHFDEVGQAVGYIAMPADQRLVGRSFFAAFVTLDPAWPSGIRGISNVVKLTVTTPP